MSEDTSIGITVIDEATLSTLRKALVEASAVATAAAAGWWETAEAVARMDATLTVLSDVLETVEEEWVGAEDESGTGGGTG